MVAEVVSDRPSLPPCAVPNRGVGSATWGTIVP